MVYVMSKYTVRAVGHPTVFTYADRVDAGIHARILESVGYTIIIRDASDRAIAMSDVSTSGAGIPAPVVLPPVDA
jgi:hypothetical protein